METLRYKWIFLAKSYLWLSRAGILLVKKDIRFNSQFFISCAILFNIKHSIELILKSLLVTVNERYDKIHNLRKLSKCLEKEAKTKSKYLTRLIEISEKYYKFDFCKGKLKEEGFFDTENEVFRFPVSRSKKYIIDFQKIKSFDESDFMEIMNDIDELERLVSKIYVIIRKRNSFTKKEKERLFSNLCVPKRIRRKIVLWNP